jgi:hypothetical protein
MSGKPSGLSQQTSKVSPAFAGAAGTPAATVTRDGLLKSILTSCLLENHRRELPAGQRAGTLSPHTLFESKFRERQAETVLTSTACG